jgi:hypothetical protein
LAVTKWKFPVSFINSRERKKRMIKGEGERERERKRKKEREGEREIEIRSGLNRLKLINYFSS